MCLDVWPISMTMLACLPVGEKAASQQEEGSGKGFYITSFKQLQGQNISAQPQVIKLPQEAQVMADVAFSVCLLFTKHQQQWNKIGTKVGGFVVIRLNSNAVALLSTSQSARTTHHFSVSHYV